VGHTEGQRGGRRVFAERMEWRREEDLRGEFKRLERGWCLGGEEFRQELLEHVQTRPGPSHFGEAAEKMTIRLGSSQLSKRLAQIGNVIARDRAQGPPSG